MRRNHALVALLSGIVCLFPLQANAQISTNPDKFLGNITTRYQMDVSGVAPYYQLWNQVTPENESKWGSVEGNRGSYNWGCDTPFNYAKNHNFTYKFHALVWGAQYPNWFTSSLSVEERYKAIVSWFDAVKKKYPTLPMIDVVNEAVGMHQQGNPLMKESLGGDGATGYDWLIKAFELAYERWPDAILIYNDYNTFQWDTDAYIALVKTLRDAGAPIDAYGCQAHDLKGVSLSSLQTVDKKIQDALKMPMFITEYDIQEEDDQKQLTDYKNQIPYLWEREYCGGITLWGYIYGATWNEGTSGIIKDNKDRAAMTWLKEYMKSDAAKTAKSPFPGMKKEASLYIKPQSLNVGKNEPMTISITAKLKTKKIKRVDLYVDDNLYFTTTQAPFDTVYVPTSAKTYNLKAVLVATDGTKYERYSSFKANNPRTAYKSQSIPGTIQFEDYDNGGEGFTYHDSDTKNEGDGNYRTGNGVDVVNGNGGKALGYTSSGEWLEYTVNVSQDGWYEYDAVVSSGTTNSGFSMSLVNSDGTLTTLATISVPQTASNDWSKYTTMIGRTAVPLPAGKQIIRVTITGSNCNLDKVTFRKINVNDNIKVSLKANPAPATVNTKTTITATVTSDTSSIAKVEFYQNGTKVSTDTSAPFEYSFTPSTKGTYIFNAIAIDSVGSKSQIASYELTVNNKREPYNGVINIPGTIEAEYFDKGGEGVSYHDTKSEIEGDGMTRSDNEGVDIVKGNGGNAIGYTASGEWLDYSINITTSGWYMCTATVSSGVSNSGFTVSIIKDGKTVTSSQISVPQTGNNDWSVYKNVTVSFNKEISAGPQTLRIQITGDNCNIDKLLIECTRETSIDEIAVDENPNGTYYNLNGVKVGPTFHGITIKDGKKVLYLE